MAKFKVGDKMRILEASKIVDAIELGFKTGEIYDVVEIDVYNDLYISNGKSWLQIFEEELQYIEKVCKPTKNQRITALEKEIAELRSFKEKIEHLEQAVQQYFAVPGESSTVEDKPKTPNQQRKEIIEKAKEFSEIEQYRRKRDGKFVVKSTVDPFNWGVRNIRFEVNDKKRTVVLLVLGEFGNVVDRHIAKCHPSDVFNEHIGKAIALGRALGLNVSEFEQAVQPTVAVGQLFVCKGNRPFGRRVGEITSMDPHFDDFGYGTAFRHTIDNGWLGEEQIKIINDTNAQYGGETK